jgi:hypothetical protein
MGNRDSESVERSNQEINERNRSLVQVGRSIVTSASQQVNWRANISRPNDPWPTLPASAFKASQANRQRAENPEKNSIARKRFAPQGIRFRPHRIPSRADTPRADHHSGRFVPVICVWSRTGESVTPLSTRPNSSPNHALCLLMIRTRPPGFKAETMPST